MGTDVAVLKATWGKPLALDVSKAARALGLERPVEWEQTLRDCSASLMRLGVVPVHAPSAGAGAAQGRA